MKNFRNILNKIAEAEQTTPDEVYKEMEKAIQLAINNPDPEVQSFWNQISTKDISPSVEEVISFISVNYKESPLIRK